jgi:hypothetical protein
MSAGQAAGTHCALSESYVGTTTQRGSCDFGVLRYGLGHKVAANLPFGASDGQFGSYSGARSPDLGGLNSSTWSAQEFCRSHARFGSLLRKRPATLVVTELTTIRLQTNGSTSFVQHSLPGISAYAIKKNDCATPESERAITFS